MSDCLPEARSFCRWHACESGMYVALLGSLAVLPERLQEGLMLLTKPTPMQVNAVPALIDIVKREHSKDKDSEEILLETFSTQNLELQVC